MREDLGGGPVGGLRARLLILFTEPPAWASPRLCSESLGSPKFVLRLQGRCPGDPRRDTERVGEGSTCHTAPLSAPLCSLCPALKGDDRVIHPLGDGAGPWPLR